jgi:branched-chain amino acid transport system substrate-binding protein
LRRQSGEIDRKAKEEGKRMSVLRRRWKLVPLVTLVAATSAVVAVSASARPAASTIKIAVMSDCQGAFGSFDNQDLAGVVTAMQQYAGGKAVNPNKPRAGWTGASIAGHPLKLVGIGCSNDRADTAIKETKRLMEQLNADIMIGPLSGDESIAVANYAKQHPTKTFVDGSAGAQDTTLKVRAPNFFRFNGDGAMWNAGLGDLAYSKLHWKTAAVIADDYSFAWTSAAGFITDFCAAGGQVTKRVFPPLNTTDYSSFAQQMPTNVDGTFVAVGGAGLIPFLKAYEQAHGPIDGKKFIGNLFWGTPGEFQQLGDRVAGAYVGGAGTAGDLNTPAAKAYNAQVAKTFKTIPPFGAAGPQASSTFTYGYYINTVGLLKGLQAVKGDISGGQKKLQAAIGKVTIASPYGPLKLDKNRQAVINVFYQQLYLKNGQLAIKTVGEVPNVDQTFGGTYSSATPAPGRTFPKCVKKKLPWQGKEITPPVTG